MLIFFYIPHENEIFRLKRGFKLHEFPLYPPLKKLVLHYKYVDIISVFLWGLLYETHMGPIWATRISDTCETRLHSPFGSMGPI